MIEAWVQKRDQKNPWGVNLSDWGEEEEIEKCSVITTVWVIPTGMTRYG